VLTPLVIPRAGYRYREDVDKERKIGDFPGCSFISPHRFYYFINYFTIQRDSVITLMDTSPPIEHILDIPASTISQLRSVPLRKNQQRCEATILDKIIEESFDVCSL
ncbi:hypothetical protein PIB30_037388, partial [Stylosanthes scabra]|nr:hypothetical protein [Stylosanthes scabra]